MELLPTTPLPALPKGICFVQAGLSRGFSWESPRTDLKAHLPPSMHYFCDMGKRREQGVAPHLLCLGRSMLPLSQRELQRRAYKSNKARNTWHLLEARHTQPQMFTPAHSKQGNPFSPAYSHLTILKYEGALAQLTSCTQCSKSDRLNQDKATTSKDTRPLLLGLDSRVQ